MAKVKMPDNGQELEMPDQVAGDDTILKQALRSVYPEIGDATITRSTVDGQMVVTVVKQAGRKGVEAAEDTVAIPDQKTKSLPVELVRTDGGTQTRAVVDRDVAREYATLMGEGVIFPPVVVFFDGAEYWLADGFHRLMAHTMEEHETVEAEVRQGTRRDAVLHSVGANAQHGLNRSNADKRRGVELLLHDEEWKEWSDHRLARLAGVSHTFVSVLRKELSGNGLRMPTERKVERGGTTYTLTPAAPQVKEPEPETEPELEVEQEAAPTVEVQPGETVRVKDPDGHEYDLVNFTKRVQTAEGTKSTEPPKPPPYAPTASKPAPKPVPTPALAPEPAKVEKPATWAESTIVVTLQLLPEDGHADGRPVLVTANTDKYPPYITLKRASEFAPWPDPVDFALTVLNQQIDEAVRKAEEAKA